MFLPNPFPFLSESSNNSLNNTLSDDISSIYSNIDILYNSSFLSDFNLMDISGTNEKENNNKKDLFKTEQLKRKRGRKINKESKKATHSALFKDNIKRKIQVHFLTFLVSLINDIISTFPFKEISLKDLAHNMKQKISKVYFEKLKKSSIKELIENINISSKFKNYEENINKEVIKKLIEYDFDYFSKLFEKDYLFFFRLYYNDEKPLNKLSLFGKTIEFSKKTESFYILIKNQEDKELKKAIIEGAKRYFIADINNIESDGEKGDDTGFNENEGFDI